MYDTIAIYVISDILLYIHSVNALEKKKTHEGRIMANTITYANTKGGVGKTTSVMLMAGILTRRGESVEVRDMDPSAGATKWKKMAAEKGDPLPYPVISANVENVGDPSDIGADWILVDTPPLESAIIQAGMEAADLVLITTQPSTLDMNRALATAETVPGLLSFLVTRVNQNTVAWKKCMDTLRDNEMPVLKSTIRARESIRNASGTSTIPRGTGYEEAVDEVVEFFQGISKEEV